MHVCTSINPRRICPMHAVSKFALACIALALLATPAMAADEARVGDPYTLNVCAVSGEPLGSMGDPVIAVVNGREVRYCCASCTKALEKDPEKYLSKVDEKMIEQQSKVYPLTACPVAGKELDGGGVAFIAGNRLVKTCCENCKAKVQADPTAAIAKLDEAAIAKQKDGYKLKECPISGKAL